MPVLQKFSILFLTIFILLSPGLSQIFGIHSEFIRTWRMYSSVGHEAPYGNFLIYKDGELDKQISIIEALGIDHIRSIQRYTGSGQLKPGFNSEEAIKTAAKKICSQMTKDEDLIFEGRIAKRGQWQQMHFSKQILCGQ